MDLLINIFSIAQPTTVTNRKGGGSDLTRDLWHNQSLFDVQLSALDQ